MQTYSQFRPTAFDTRGLNADQHQIGAWLVLPCSQTRDSGVLERSNFASALIALGGESDDVEVHRFGHWGPGWFELILVRPGTVAATTAEDIEAGLSDYPVIDDEHFSNLEYSEACEAWAGLSVAERVEACQRYRVCVFAARHDDLPEDPQGSLVQYLTGN